MIAPTVHYSMVSIPTTSPQLMNAAELGLMSAQPDAVRQWKPSSLLAAQSGRKRIHSEDL